MSDPDKANGVDEIVKHLADTFRKDVKAQVDLWRRIPLLALDADGRGGWSERYSMAYEHGYWDLTDQFAILVDLANGDLVSFHGPLAGVMRPDQASDSGVAAYAAAGNRPDAAEIIKELRAATSQPFHQPRTHTELVERIARTSGLGESYEARNRVSYPRFSVIF